MLREHATLSVATSMPPIAKRVPCEICPLRAKPHFRDFTLRSSPSSAASSAVSWSSSPAVRSFPKARTTSSCSPCCPAGPFASRRWRMVAARSSTTCFPAISSALQGTIIGEMEHSVESLSTVVLCVFQRDRLSSLFENHAGLAFDVTWLASREERMLDEHLLSIGRRSATERAAYLIAFFGAAGGTGRSRPRADPNHPAARRRYAGAVDRSHQQDAAQARRAGPHPLARPGLRSARSRRACRPCRVERAGRAKRPLI